MSEYLILIYGDEQAYAATDDAFNLQLMEAHNRFSEQIAEQGGKMVGGNALMPTGTATTVRGDVVTDGPFVETKEALGGYCFFEADDLDAAIELASKIPAASMGGAIEVRPIVEL